MAVIAGRPAVTESGLSACFIFQPVARAREAWREIETDNENKKAHNMDIHLTFGPLLALIAGILILLMPKLLNFIVALYLILVGLIGVFGLNAFHLH